MALFTDGSASTISDLLAHDSQLLDVASTEGIDVTCKLALAQQEIGVALCELLSRFTGPAGGGVIDVQQATIAGVVVTPPLKLWHSYLALELFYGDAYNSQLNDRYKGKRDQFHDKAKWAHEKLIQIGIGLAAFPLPQAATPRVIVTQGSSLPLGTYYVSMAWANSANDEGACAVPAAIEIESGTLLVQPVKIPANAKGWNVYMGVAPDALMLQTASLMLPGQSWLARTFNLAGRPPGDGQSPDYLQPVPRWIQRG